MKKFLVRILCAFIPIKTIRRKIRAFLLAEGKIIIFDDEGNEFKFSRRKYPQIRGTMNASNAVLKIHQSNSNLKLKFFITSPDAECIIHKGVSGKIDIRLAYGKGQKLHIGANTTIYGASFRLDEDAQIFVGENNLISTDVYIAGTDGHAIIDNQSGEVVNAIKKPLVIGDHCWIGTRVSILKNAYIPNNTIVGAASVVSHKFTEEYTAIAGNPACVVKQNVSWKHENAYFLINQGNSK